MEGQLNRYSNLLSDSTPVELITPKKFDNILSHFCGKMEEGIPCEFKRKS